MVVVVVVNLFFMMVVMWAVVNMLSRGLLVVLVVQLWMWVLMVKMSVMVWVVGRLRKMRDSLRWMWWMGVVRVERLQFRMKGNEGRVEQVWLRRVGCCLVGGFRKRVRSVPESVTKQSWRMCNGGVDDPLVWICSGNHLGDGHVLLQEVERDFAEVEVFSQLRIREKNLSHRFTDNLLKLLLDEDFPTQEVLSQDLLF